jgi:hypothetical protein
LSAPPADVDAAPRSARWLVGTLLVLLLVPGLVGFDAWPLTGWRLFSRARGSEISPEADQPAWGISVVDRDGSVRAVSLEELPLAYRHAQWPMATLPDASTERRDAVCAALLEAVTQVAPTTVGLRITRDDPRLVEMKGRWDVIHDLEVFHSCPTTRADRSAYDETHP